MKARSLAFLIASALFTIVPEQRVAGQTSTYALLSGSDLTDDCLICDRLSLPIPLQGTFELLPLDSNPLFTRYQLTNISFRTTGTNGRTYEVKGDGIYQVGGEVALRQDLTPNVQINVQQTLSAIPFLRGWEALGSFS